MSNRPQTYLIVDAGPHAPSPKALAEAVRRAAIACVLLQPAEGANETQLRALVEAIQAVDCAALLADDAARALGLGADGVHLAHHADADLAQQAYRTARAILGDGRVVGASGGLSRHTSMVLAELGADYVALGGAPDHDPAAQLEMVAWWAELFSVPCVAWGVLRAAEVPDLAAAGADFIAAGPQGGLESAIAVLSKLSEPEEAMR